MRPPRDLLLPSFWEQHGWLVAAGAMVALGLLALGVWRWRRPKPAVAVAPSVAARQALEQFRERADDLELVGEVSRVVRRYVLAVFVLQDDELTTEELLKAVRNCFSSNPELLEALASLLRECDTRKFAPVPLPAPASIVQRALELIAQLDSNRPSVSQAAGVQASRAAVASPAA